MFIENNSDPFSCFEKKTEREKNVDQLSSSSDSDEPELEFSGSSRAKLGHFNFRAETELNRNFV